MYDVKLTKKFLYLSYGDVKFRVDGKHEFLEKILLVTKRVKFYPLVKKLKTLKNITVETKISGFWFKGVHFSTEVPKSGFSEVFDEDGGKLPSGFGWNRTQVTKDPDNCSWRLKFSNESNFKNNNPWGQHYSEAK